MTDDWSLAITGAGENSTEFETIYNMVIQPKCIEGRGKPADVIFLDLSKAFDTDSHRILLE